MDNQFKPLAVGEVLSVDESAQIFIGNRTFRVGEFLVAIKKKLVEVLGDEWTPEQESWFSESGIPCEVLQFAANDWKQGKVRLNLEFCLVEAQDKVDDISAIGGETLQSKSTHLAEQPDLTELETSNDSGLELGVGAATAAVTATGISVAEALEEDASTAISDEMTLQPTLDADEDIAIDQTPTSTEDDFDLGDFSDSQEDIAIEETPTSTEDEFDLGDFSDSESESEEDIGFEQTPTSQEDDFDLGEFSDSVDEDIEFVESPTAAEEDLLDLSAVSTDSSNDFDLGEMSDDSDEDMFQLDDISFDEESENGDDNSLMDDVWQEMNELK
ncbi:KGK domain-containing protein [Moorena producens JHB]|uniref:KGK domain-containing protein n=1 Tax=Moorena producens (strain JHB) TaxID=1454205 RepID=A0A1D9FWK0_MOOP1|nr:KGK domain-containing protein [Moorena producens]AOY79727.1 KGK domain-containing protein [Moorena producens JHB]